jgi:hypothetical protein
MATLFDEPKRQLATSSLSLLVASLRTTFALNDFVGRWCHQKLKAFKFQKAARNHVRLNVSNWMMMGALTGRSETGSETEQVGSGMNGRRRS